MNQHILCAQQHAPGSGTTEWEREMDRLVRKLRGLTTDETKLVEDSAR